MENAPPVIPEQPEFMTVKQAARHLNVSADRIYRLCTTGKISHYKFGDGRWAMRIRRSDLLDYVQRCRVQKWEQIAGARKRRKKPVQLVELYKHLDLEPHHECGAMTKAGTPCKRMTPDEHCPQHRAGSSGQ